MLRGLPHNVTTEMDLELWRAGRPGARATRRRPRCRSPPDELADRYRAGTLPPALQHGLAAFLDRYGHRAVAEIDLGMPRWSDDPAHMLGVLANYLRLDDPGRRRRPTPQFAAGRRGGRGDGAHAGRAGPAALAGGARASVGFALGRARQLVGLREMPKYHLVTR